METRKRIIWIIAVALFAVVRFAVSADTGDVVCVCVCVCLCVCVCAWVCVGVRAYTFNIRQNDEKNDLGGGVNFRAIRHSFEKSCCHGETMRDNRCGVVHGGAIGDASKRR